MLNEKEANKPYERTAIYHKDSQEDLKRASPIDESTKDATMDDLKSKDALSYSIDHAAKAIVQASPVKAPPPDRSLNHSKSDIECIKERAKVMAEAEKHARYAVSSIQFDDVAAALSNLDRARDILLSLK